jgi:hypothetical protein
MGAAPYIVAGLPTEEDYCMELDGPEVDEHILLENIVGVARLDEEVKGLLAQFETASNEELIELKEKIKAIESLRSTYRARLESYRNR